MFNPFSFAYRSRNANFFHEKFDRKASPAIYYSLLESIEHYGKLPDQEEFAFTLELNKYVSACMLFTHDVLTVSHYVLFDEEIIDEHQASAYCACCLMGADPLAIVIPF